MGVGFTKWRAALQIGPGTPSDYAIACNAWVMAQVAALSQEAGLVPIVEPEVMLFGDHTIETCFAITERVLARTFEALYLHRVALEGTLVKASMVLSGDKCPVQADVDEVAAETVKVFLRQIPAAIPGIVFLSGGQSDWHATAHLNAMNADYELPWSLSFSYARAFAARADGGVEEPGGECARGAGGSCAQGEDEWPWRRWVCGRTGWKRRSSLKITIPSSGRRAYNFPRKSPKHRVPVDVQRLADGMTRRAMTLPFAIRCQVWGVRHEARQPVRLQQPGDIHQIPDHPAAREMPVYPLQRKMRVLPVQPVQIIAHLAAPARPSLHLWQRQPQLRAHMEAGQIDQWNAAVE